MIYTRSSSNDDGLSVVLGGLNNKPSSGYNSSLRVVLRDSTSGGSGTSSSINTMTSATLQKIYQEQYNKIFGEG